MTDHRSGATGSAALSPLPDVVRSASRSDLKVRGNPDEKVPSIHDGVARSLIKVGAHEVGCGQEPQQDRCEIGCSGHQLGVGESLDIAGDVQARSAELDRAIPPDEVGPAARLLLRRGHDPGHDFGR